jgi:hypothetical protein
LLFFLLQQPQSAARLFDRVFNHGLFLSSWGNDLRLIERVFSQSDDFLSGPRKRRSPFDILTPLLLIYDEAMPR